jgi:hypothetical protein
MQEKEKMGSVLRPVARRRLVHLLDRVEWSREMSRRVDAISAEQDEVIRIGLLEDLKFELDFAGW